MEILFLRNYDEDFEDEDNGGDEDDDEGEGGTAAAKSAAASTQRPGSTKNASADDLEAELKRWKD